jgi:hypothetical protein
MDNLLVGCRVIGFRNDYHDDSGHLIKNGVIVKTFNKDIATILMESGDIVHRYWSEITIHPDDIKFLMQLGKNISIKEFMIKNHYSRLDIMDLEE